MKIKPEYEADKLRKIFFPEIKTVFALKSLNLVNRTLQPLRTHRCCDKQNMALLLLRQPEKIGIHYPD